MLGSRKPWGIAAAFLALLLGAGAQAQQPPVPNRDVTIQNETDLTLQNLYVYVPGNQDRGADRLGNDMVAPSATMRLRLNRVPCTVDIVAVWADGTEDLRRRADICRSGRLLYGDPATPTVEAMVANRSDVVLRELYAVKSAPDRAEDAWGPDRLVTDVVDAGASFRLRLRSRDCVFDVRAVYADEREEVKTGLNLCTDRNVVFDRSTIPRPQTHTIAFVNRHLASIQEIYVSSSTENDWGPDRLADSDVLVQGQEATLEVEGECETDIRIVFANGGAEERREIDICENPRVVFAPGWVVQTPPAEAPDPAPETTPGPPVAEPAARPNPGLRLRNAGPLPVVEIYVLPAGSPAGTPRGNDRLGADILAVGDRLDVAPLAPDACAGDVVVVFRDGREVVHPGVDFCAGEELEVP